MPASKQPGSARAVIAGSFANSITMAGYGNAYRSDMVVPATFRNTSFWQVGGTPGIGYTQGGKAISFNGSSSYFFYDADKDFLNATTGESTLMCLITPRGSLVADSRIFSITGGSAANPIVALQSDNGGTATTAGLWVRNDAGSTGQATVASEFVLGKESLLIGVISGGTLYLYTRSGSGSAASPGGSIGLNSASLGCLWRTTPAAFYQGDISLWATWNRALTLNEINQLRVNPWQIFADPAQSRMNLIRSAYVPAAGGTFQTLVGQRFSLAGSRGLAGG